MLQDFFSSVRNTALMFRVSNVRVTILFFYIGIFVVGGYSRYVDLILMPFIFVLLYAGASLRNFLLDKETDSINNKFNPLMATDKKSAFTLTIMLFVLTLFLAFTTSQPALVVSASIVLFLLGLLYSSASFKVSYKPFGKISFMFLAYCLVPGVLGIMLNSGNLEHFIFIFGLSVLYSSFMIYSDVPDMKGDKKMEKNTLAVVMGIKNLSRLGLTLSIIGGSIVWLTYISVTGKFNYVLLGLLMVVFGQVIVTLDPNLLASKKAKNIGGYSLIFYVVLLLLSLFFLRY